MTSVYGPIVLPACTGADGSGASTATTKRVTGKVDGYYITYTGDDPGTTDVTIATGGVSHPARTLLTRTDSAADGYYRVRSQVCGNTGSALTLDGTRIMAEPDYVDDTLVITVAQANTDDIITVWVVMQ